MPGIPGALLLAECYLPRIISAPCGPRYHCYQVPNCASCKLPGSLHHVPADSLNQVPGTLPKVWSGQESQFCLLATFLNCLCRPALGGAEQVAGVLWVALRLSFKCFSTLMCITVLGRLLPVVPRQKMPVIYIVTARKNSALPLLAGVQKGLGFEVKKTLIGFLIERSPPRSNPCNFSSARSFK